MRLTHKNQIIKKIMIKMIIQIIQTLYSTQSKMCQYNLQILKVFNIKKTLKQIILLLNDQLKMSVQTLKKKSIESRLQLSKALQALKKNQLLNTSQFKKLNKRNNLYNENNIKIINHDIEYSSSFNNKKDKFNYDHQLRRINENGYDKSIKSKSKLNKIVKLEINKLNKLNIISDGERYHQNMEYLNQDQLNLFSMVKKYTQEYDISNKRKKLFTEFQSTKNASLDMKNKHVDLNNFIKNEQNIRIKRCKTNANNNKHYKNQIYSRNDKINLNHKNNHHNKQIERGNVLSNNAMYMKITQNKNNLQQIDVDFDKVSVNLNSYDKKMKTEQSQTYISGKKANSKIQKMKKHTIKIKSEKESNQIRSMKLKLS